MLYAFKDEKPTPADGRKHREIAQKIANGEKSDLPVDFDEREMTLLADMLHKAMKSPVLDGNLEEARREAIRIDVRPKEGATRGKAAA